MDTDWSSAETNSSINDLKKSYFFTWLSKKKNMKSYVVLQNLLLAQMVMTNFFSTPCLLWMWKI